MSSCSNPGCGMVTLLATLLGFLAALLSMGATLGICYLYWRRRRTRQKIGEKAPLQVSPTSLKSAKDDGLDVISAAPSINSYTNGDLEEVKSESSGPISFFANLIPGFEGAEEEPDAAGKINFSLEYDFHASNLILKIYQAKDLPAKDITGTSDPYVRVCLLPDKKHKLETKIKHRTLNPRWNETFYFEGYPLHKLQKSILYLHVYDYDRFSRDDSIGEVYLPLDQVDFTQKPVFWKTIKSTEKIKLGELHLTLNYIPRTNELSLHVGKARNLKAKDITGSSDPYVKVWLHQGDKRMEKKKTRILKRTLNPTFDETFRFNVSWENIRETSLVVTVMDYDQIGRNEAIGGLVLSSRSGPSESRHWGDMLANPRTPVSQWHVLKPV